MLWPLLILGVGIFLSAFFSGIETGFYRASRVRVVLAALDGDTVSKSLLKLINNPTLFVATTLIGNNVANYLCSLAIVLLTSQLFTSDVAEMLMPIAVAPLLFVYGELLPKNLFFLAPNRLLRLGAPMLLVFKFLFTPVAYSLWLLGKVLERSIGQSPETIRLALARKELQQVLEEGYEAGILLPTQRQLAQSFFLVASKPVREFYTPRSKIHAISADTPVTEILKWAKRFELADIPVTRGKSPDIAGYFRTDELLLQADKTKPCKNIRTLREIPASELFGEAVLQMQASRETLVKVTGKKGQLLGILSSDQLTNPLLEGPLLSLRR